MEVSDRKHLTSPEVERLIEATKGSRNEVRDRWLLLPMNTGMKAKGGYPPGAQETPEAA